MANDDDEFEFYIAEPVIVGTIPGEIVGCASERDKADKFCVEFENDSGVPHRGWFFASQIKRTPKH